jgi:hypothetical protein
MSRVPTLNWLVENRPVDFGLYIEVLKTNQEGPKKTQKNNQQSNPSRKTGGSFATNQSPQERWRGLLEGSTSDFRAGMTFMQEAAACKLPCS